MDSNKLANWLQVAANIGILTGLILVGLQMQQNFKLSQGQIISDGYVAARADRAILMGESPTVAIAKSLTDPESLTMSEVLIVDSYLTQAWLRQQRIQVLASAGVYIGNLPFVSDELSDYWAEYYFGNSFAKSWFEARRSRGEFRNKLGDMIAVKFPLILDTATLNLVLDFNPATSELEPEN